MQTDEKEFTLRYHEEAIEMFDLAAEKVFKNILDPNTGNQAREIVLKMKLVPDEDTGMISTEFQVGKKLAPQKCHREKMVIGMEKGKYIGRRIMHIQQQLPLNVHTIADKENKGHGE